MALPENVIQAPKPEPRIMRYELSDYEWTEIKPHAVVDTNGLPVHLALTR